jgi:ABC-type molybdate transport system substrate-binding protein
LAPGEYTISIAPVSEILANKNAKYLGPVIDEYQALQILEAVVGTRARDEKSTKKFVDYLRGPEFGAVLNRNGFTTGKYKRKYAVAPSSWGAYAVRLQSNRERRDVQ